VQARQLLTLALVAASAYFVDLFLPWFGPSEHSISGWSAPLAAYSGLLALGGALIAGARRLGVWSTAGSSLVLLFLTAAAGAMALAALGLFGRRLRSPLASRLERVGERALAPLRALHSGHIGDYVAWLVSGVALLGGAFALALR
jgi:multicomponent Na+:H+ antiporter subunit D